MSRVVEGALDLAPPGYSDWRAGSSTATWRLFATELITAKPRPRAGLPTDSILHDPLPYDLRPEDIPVRFIGEGQVADRIQSNPASFHVPSRREAEKVLKLFGCELDKSKGKGEHQNWTAADKRAFSLPTRDPVSKEVFDNLRAFIGKNKSTYVTEIRPRL